MRANESNILSRIPFSYGFFSNFWQCLWHLGTIHTSRISYHTKTFNRWIPSNSCAGCLCLICVTGSWVSLWSDFILTWYNYVVICTLVTIFNWWLSSKDMKLRVKKIKETLVAFHWPMLRIILLCSLESGHPASLFVSREC